MVPEGSRTCSAISPYLESKESSPQIHFNIIFRGAPFLTCFKNEGYDVCKFVTCTAREQVSTLPTYTISFNRDRKENL